MLAISLHAVNDELRNILVPINKKYPLKELMQACRDYPGASNARRITFEYVMLKGVNDTPAQARALIKLIRGIPCKFNLIPFNPWPGSAYQGSGLEHARAFQEELLKRGMLATLRISKGQDIQAACGQLITEGRERGRPGVNSRPVAGALR